MQACTLDIALNKSGLQLHTLVQVLQGTLSIAAEVSEGGTHIESQCLEVSQITNFQSLLKSGRSILITITSLLGHRNQTLAQLTLSRVLAQFNRLLQALGQRAGTEALQIVRNKSGTRQLLAPGIQNCLALLLGHLLEQPLEGVAAHVVGESVDNAAGGKVKQRIAELAKVFVCNGAAVQGLHVLAVHGKGGGGVLDDLVPLRQDIVASGTVRVEDGVGGTDDRSAVQINCLGVVLNAISLVTSSLQLGGIFLPSLPR